MVSFCRYLQSNSIQIFVLRIVFTLLFFLVIINYAEAQNGLKVKPPLVYSYLPKDTLLNKPYIFYLHPRIYEEFEEGDVPVHKKYGFYDHKAIVNRLSDTSNFIVIDFHRSKNTNSLQFAQKVALQIDTLLKKGLSPSNITVIGSGKGALIAMFVSSFVKNSYVKYVLMSACDYEIGKDPMIKMKGQVLSIYDISDNTCTSCSNLLNMPKHDVLFKELELDTHLGYALFFTPHSHWIQPVLNWVRF